MTFQSEYDLTVSRLIEATPSAVWQAWQDPTLLVQWFAPQPVVTLSTKHEFFVGGGFGTTMRLPDGTEFSGEGCFLDLRENERIVWTSALQGGWRPTASDLPFTGVVTLREVRGGLAYTATALHRNDEDRQKHADMGFVDGWGRCIDQLAALVRT